MQVPPQKFSWPDIRHQNTLIPAGVYCCYPEWLRTDRLAAGQCTQTERESYPLVIDDFADIDGGLGILPQVSLLLEDEAVSALPTQLCTLARVDTKAGVKK